MNDPVLKAGDIKKVNCSNCGKNLFMIPAEEKGEEVIFEMTVGCGYCGDKSFEVPVYGPIKYVPAPQLAVSGFTQDGKKVTFQTKKRS